MKDGKLVRVEGNDQHSKPKPCLKGLTSLQNVYDPNRLLYPVKRTNPKKGIGEDPKWERIGWDEALETIASEFNKAKETYGAASVTFHSGDPKRAPAGVLPRGRALRHAERVMGRRAMRLRPWPWQRS